MKITTRNVQFRDPNGRMVSSAIIANGSLHDEVIDYLDNNPQALGDAVADATESWLAENITEPTQPAVDASLSVTGAAADAKKVGDELSDLKSQIALNSGVPTEVKLAFDAIVQNIAFLNGEDYAGYKSTIHAWATEINLVSISAVFEQGSNIIYDSDSLDTLKQYLTVTASWSNGTTSTVASADYTLSGTLAEGTSIITVSYASKTTTFNVTVSERSVPSEYTKFDYIAYTGTAPSTNQFTDGRAITTQTFDDLRNIIVDFEFMPTVAKTAATPLFGGRGTGAGTDTANQIGFYYRTDTQRISAWVRGTAAYLEGVSTIAVGQRTHVNLNPHKASPATLSAGENSYDAVWGSSNVMDGAFGYFGSYIIATNKITANPGARIGIVNLYDLDENLIGNYIPCVRQSDNVIGVYDTVSQTFHTAETIGRATIGNNLCVYEVGNWEA